MKINAFNLDLSTSHHRSETIQIQRESTFYQILNGVPNPEVDPGPEQQWVSLSLEEPSHAHQLRMELEKMRALLDAAIEALNQSRSQGFRITRIRELKIPTLAYETSVTQTQTIQESSQFTASGRVTTADGKTLDLHLALSMESTLVQTVSQTQTGYAFIDPLVLHTKGELPRGLSNVEFTFDMDMDGQEESIIAPQIGTGFIALDINGDGKINDGSELFGPATGNGFLELAAHDQDQNGWIDENDPIYENLSLWGLTPQGKMEMKGLKDAGVGALYLEAGETPFDIRNGDQNLVARVKRSSLALGEDGQIMPVQELDWTV